MATKFSETPKSLENDSPEKSQKVLKILNQEGYVLGISDVQKEDTTITAKELLKNDKFIRIPNEKMRNVTVVIDDIIPYTIKAKITNERFKIITEDYNKIKYKYIEGFARAKIIIENLTDRQKIFISDHSSDITFFDTCKKKMSSKFYEEVFLLITCSQMIFKEISDDDKDIYDLKKAVDEVIILDEEIDSLLKSSMKLKAFFKVNLNLY